MKRGGFLLAGLGLLGYWPVLNAHPLMDDHLFFAWLDQTPWTEALEQRLTGNWIPYFNQIQMYRPVSGVVQVLAYRLFGHHPLPQHLFSFLLHVAASLLAGFLTFRLSQDSKAGWCAAAILLLHPRAALGVSLIFNFHDVLAACLMLAALLCLWSVKKNAGEGHSSLKLAGLWLCTGLALGVKELALPLVASLLLAEWLWEEVGFSLGRVLRRQAIPALLLCAYLFARMKFVGHPIRTHGHPSAFPLPANAEFWALSWDFLLLGCSSAVAGFIHRAAKSNSAVARQAPWTLLWSGLMLLPAVHFCSQVTLRPWFFDERYWYVPLVPLSILAGMCLARGGWINAGLAAAALAITLPGWLGLVAIPIVVVSPSLQFHRFHIETQRVAAVLLVAALALGTLKQCQAIRLRADEAAGVHRAVEAAAKMSPAGSLMAILNFNETTVERETSFNGDLQWLLQPPFFREDLNPRLFFSYSTWDMTLGNRFRDRTSEGLLPQMRQGNEVSLYYWNPFERKLNSLGREKWRGTADHAAIQLVMKPSSRPASDGRVQWRSEKLAADPVLYRYLSIKVNRSKQNEPKENTLALLWSSQRSQQDEELRLKWSGRGNQAPGPATVWLHLGRYVDWLLAGGIKELVLEMPVDSDFVAAVLSSDMPVEVRKQADRIDHFRNPEMKFEWLGETWWVVGH